MVGSSVQPARGEVDERGADLLGRGEPVDVALHRFDRLLQRLGVGLGAETNDGEVDRPARVGGGLQRVAELVGESVGLSASLRPSVNTTACDGVPSR